MEESKNLFDAEEEESSLESIMLFDPTLKITRTLPDTPPYNPVIVLDASELILIIDAVDNPDGL